MNMMKISLLSTPAPTMMKMMMMIKHLVLVLKMYISLCQAKDVYRNSKVNNKMILLGDLINSLKEVKVSLELSVGREHGEIQLKSVVSVIEFSARVV